jgi:hypothetical protein
MYRSLRTGDGDKDRGTLNLMVSVGCGVRLRSKTRRWSRPRNHRPRVSPFPLPTANSGRNNYGDRVEFELSSLSRVNLQSTPQKFWRTFVSDPRVCVCARTGGATRICPSFCWLETVPTSLFPAFSERVCSSQHHGAVQLLLRSVNTRDN